MLGSTGSLSFCCLVYTTEPLVDLPYYWFQSCSSGVAEGVTWSHLEIQACQAATVFSTSYCPASGQRGSSNP